MAIPLHKLTASGQGTGSGGAFTLPSLVSGYAVNDVICVYLSQDTASGVLSCSSAGWTTVSTNSGATPSGQANGVLAYKKAASTNESPPTFACANQVLIWTSFVLLDVDPDAIIDIASSNAAGTKGFDGVSSTTMPGVTANYPDSLAIYCVTVDGGVLARFKCDDVVPIARHINSGNQLAHVVAYHQLTSTTVPTPTAYFPTADGGNKWTVCFRNKSGGSLAPQFRGSMAELDVGKIANWFGDFGATHYGTPSWGTPRDFGPSSIGGITTSTNAATFTNGTFGGWGLATNITNGLANVEEITGASRSVTPTDLAGKTIAFLFGMSGLASSASRIASKGMLYGLSDGTNWAVYQLVSQALGWANSELRVAVIDPSTATPLHSSGAPLNFGAITKDAFFWHRANTTSALQEAFVIRNLMVIDKCVMTGGGASKPLSWLDLLEMLNLIGTYRLAVQQGPNQLLAKFDLQIGDGNAATYFDSGELALAFPQAYSLTSIANWQQDWNIGAGGSSVTIKAKSGDTINMQSGLLASALQNNFAFDAASSTTANYSMSAEIVAGMTPTLLGGISLSGGTYSGCNTVQTKGANLTDYTIKKPNASVGVTAAAVSVDTSGSTLRRVTINLEGATGTPGYHLALESTCTSITLRDTIFSGASSSAGNKKVHVLATIGTVTIIIDGSTTLALSDVASEGATVVIDAPSYYRGLAFTGLLAGSVVKVYDAGTTTERFSTTSSGTSETWNDATSGSKSVDYVVLKAGYLPIRVPGVTVTGQTTSAGLTGVPVSQQVDRAYQTPSGLTLATNTFADATAKKFGLTVASTLQNLYSYLMDRWIALAGSTYANKPFPMTANGPNSFSWLNGWEADLTTYPSTINLLSRDGMRYLDSAGTVTAMWAAILSVGTPAGMQVRYIQSHGGSPADALATGPIDQLVQIYGDATHGNYDRTGYLVAKVQADGYDEAVADVVATYGALEDQLYVIGLTPISNGLATGDPGVTGVTITDHGASPVTWNGKAFSITITDSGSNSGTAIMRWLRYNYGVGGTFQGANAFNWHDLVRTNGSKYKTVRSELYGDVGATLKGVRVIRGAGTAHPDFDAFTADDGTVYNPPVTANITWASALDDTTVIVYNDSQSGYMLDGGSVVSGGAGYTLALTLPHAHVAAGDTIRLRHGHKSKLAGELVGVMTSSGLALLGSQAPDTAYSAWAIDGASCTEFSPNYTQIDINIAGGTPVGYTQAKRLGAYYKYLLTLPAGLDAFYGAFDFVSPAEIRQNVSVVDVVLKASLPVVFSDFDVKYYRSDFSIPYDVTGAAMFISYAGVPFTVEVGSAVTPSDKNDIAVAVRAIMATELARIDTNVSEAPPTADAIKTAILTAPDTLTVKKFLGLS